jgi:hypothetical protein
MKTLLITRIKPNPAGKDRNRFGTATASQLAAEWVDFKNTGSAAVDLCGIELYHLAYAPGSTQGRWDKIIDFNGILQVGRTVRVHSGSGPESVIRPEDRAGADHHLFTGRNYVWNNREGDCPTLFDPMLNQNVDQASYDPYPPEGQVLVRSGSKLIPVTVPAYTR